MQLRALQATIAAMANRSVLVQLADGTFGILHFDREVDDWCLYETETDDVEIARAYQEALRAALIQERWDARALRRKLKAWEPTYVGAADVDADPKWTRVEDDG